jgi:DNA-binding NarL/FixJ family response regulator
MPQAMFQESQSTGFARSVLVVEDEPLLRELIVSALEGRGFEVVAAGSASDGVRAFRALDPDGVVIDIDLGPGPNGFDLAERFLSAETGVAVVFLTDLPDPRFAGRAPGELPPGIAYLRKGAVHEIDVLVRTLDATMRGEVGEGMRHDRDPERPLASLTRHQVEALRLVALGRTNAQIAEQRGTTVKAVERVVARAFQAAGGDPELDGNLRVDAARRFIRTSGNPLELPGDEEQKG